MMVGLDDTQPGSTPSNHNGYLECRNVNGLESESGRFRDSDLENDPDHDENDRQECRKTMQDLIAAVSGEEGEALEIPHYNEKFCSDRNRKVDSLIQVENASSQCCERLLDEDVDNEIIQRLKGAKESRSLEGLVNELPNVEGFAHEGWGAAVEIKNAAFYPTTVTCALENDEFQKFLETTYEEDFVSENNQNIIQSNLVKVNEDKGSDDETHEDVVAQDPNSTCHNVPLDDAVPSAVENIDEGVNVEFHVELYSSLLNMNIEMDKLKDAILPSDMLDYVLQEESKSSVVNMEIETCPLPDSIPESFTSTNMEEAGDENNDANTPQIEQDKELPESQISTDVESDTSSLYENNIQQNDKQQNKASEPATSVPIQELETEKTKVIADSTFEESVHDCSNNVPKSITSPSILDCSNNEVPKSIARPSILDPRLRRRTRSTEDSCSQVSLASTSSSHSSIRPCSVVLTRLTPTTSPVQHTSINPEENHTVNKKYISSDTSASFNVTDVDTIENGSPYQHDRKDLLKQAVNPVGGKSPLPCSGEISGTKEDAIDELSVGNEDEVPLSVLKARIQCRKEEAGQSNSSSANNTASITDEVVNLSDSDDEREPIRLYEPIRLDDPSPPPQEVRVFKTEVEENCEQNTDAVSSSRAMRTKRKRKSTHKIEEIIIKKPCTKPKEPPIEKPLSAMSKRELQNYVKKESKKAQPDFSRLSEALNITYDHHRKAMYDKGQVDVEDLKKKHPELLHYQMVKEELGRILSDKTKMDRLEKELNEEILSAALGEKKKKASFPKKRHNLWQNAIKLWEENKEGPHSSQYRRVLGILVVCFEFGDNAVVNSLCKLLKQNETLGEKDMDKMCTPTIVVRESELFSISDESEIWIYVDGIQYLKVPNMYEAVLCVFAAYYIFNINYDSKLKSLFQFFDYLCDNQQSTYKKSKTKWPPQLLMGGKKSFLAC